MKKITALISLLFICAFHILAEDSITAAKAPATTASKTVPSTATVSLAQRGDSAYTADNFVMAEQLYLQALKANGSSPALFYNLGNAYYRQGNLGKAVVYYERALKLDPTDEDARANLEFVQSKLTDKQLDDGSFMSSLSQQIVQWFTADTWATLSVILFAVFIACVAVYLFSSAVMVRKFSFFGGGVIFILTLVAVLISFAAANRVESTDYAVILPPAAQLSTSPREARSQSEQAFLLHEGTKVLIVDSISSATDGKWYEVRVGARDRAWCRAADLERI